MLDPNDTQAEAVARPTNLTVDTPRVLVGRIASVPDEEWFSLRLPALCCATWLR